MSVRVAGLLQRADVEGPLARRRLAHGERHLGRQDEVDLLVEDPVFLGDADGDEQHAEDIGAVRLEGRPRVLVDAGRRDEPLDRARVELDRGLGQHLLARGVQQVDPARGRTHGPERSAAVGRS